MAAPRDSTCFVCCAPADFSCEDCGDRKYCKECDAQEHLTGIWKTHERLQLCQFCECNRAVFKCLNCPISRGKYGVLSCEDCLKKKHPPHRLETRSHIVVSLTAAAEPAPAAPPAAEPAPADPRVQTSSEIVITNSNLFSGICEFMSGIKGKYIEDDFRTLARCGYLYFLERRTWMTDQLRLIFVEAALASQLDILRWVCGRGFVIEREEGVKLIMTCIEKGLGRDVIDFIYSSRPHWESYLLPLEGTYDPSEKFLSLYTIAAKSPKRDEVIKWLLEKYPEKSMDSHRITLFALSGSYDVSDAFVYYWKTFFRGFKVGKRKSKKAVRQSDVEAFLRDLSEEGNVVGVKFCLELLEKESKLSSILRRMSIDAISNIIRMDNLEWLMLLHEHGNPVDLTRCLKFAIEYSAIKITKWLILEENIRLQSPVDVDTSLSLELYRFLYEHYPNGFTVFKSTLLRLFKSNEPKAIDTIKFLFEVGYSEYTQDMLQEANSILKIEWLCGHGCDVEANLLDLAAKNGYLHVVKWYADHGLAPTSDTMKLVAEGGYVDIMKWMISRYEDFRPTDSEMNCAIEKNRLIMVKWLHESFPELSCSSDLLKKVLKYMWMASPSHTDIFLYACKNLPGINVRDCIFAVLKDEDKRYMLKELLPLDPTFPMPVRSASVALIALLRGWSFTKEQIDEENVNQAFEVRAFCEDRILRETNDRILFKLRLGFIIGLEASLKWDKVEDPIIWKERLEVARDLGVEDLIRKYNNKRQRVD